MPLVVYKAGQSLGKRSLGGVLRARWDEVRASVLSAISMRNSVGAPLVDETSGAKIRDPGPYPGDAQLDDVTIEVVAASVSEMHVIEADLQAAVKAVDDAAPDDKAHAKDAESQASARVVRALVSRVGGVEDDRGNPLTLSPANEEHMRILVDNRLIDPILTAAMWLQSVRGETRKNSGALQPSRISAPTTATHADLASAVHEAVTMTRPPLAG
jgi:hypothetical protein